MSQAIMQPRAIRNKDCVLLSKVFYIMQEICQTERLRQWQQDRMFSITQKVTGMPGGKGGVPVGFDAAFATLSELDAVHGQRIADYARELKRAEKVLNSIPSVSMRSFVMMRYLMDLPNVQIMRDLNMSEKGFRRACQSIEEAEDMAHVVWRERYILTKNTENNL